MRHLKATNLGQLVATSMLVMSCGVKSLGEDFGTGGNSTFAGGNSALAGGNSASAGGNSASAGGNAASAGGSPSISDGAAPIGGSPTVAASTTAVPYVLDPTLPIDPTCTCETSDKICNAARECVPRCDDAGRCARWLVDNDVADMLVDGSTLVYLVASKYGLRPGVLYRVDEADSAPTLIASDVGEVNRILGRSEHTTYMNISAGPLVSVSDGGVVNVLDEHAFAELMWGHWVVWASVQDATNSWRLMGLDTAGNNEPVVLVDSRPAYSTFLCLTVLDDEVVYYSDDGDENYSTCTLQLSNYQRGPTCVNGADTRYHEQVSSGDRYYWSGWDGRSGRFSVQSYAPSTKPLFTLYDINVKGDGAGAFVKYANGWLYIEFVADPDADDDTWNYTAKFQRVPVGAVSSPQNLLPDELLYRHLQQHPTYATGLIFSVGSTKLYWASYTYSTSSSQPQYIFSAPLPPQPCDAELPCADTSLVCTDGFCGPA